VMPGFPTLRDEASGDPQALEAAKSTAYGRVVLDLLKRQALPADREAPARPPAADSTWRDRVPAGLKRLARKWFQ